LASKFEMKEPRHWFHEETSICLGGHWFHEGTSMCPGEHLPTVTLGRCSRHFRGEVVTSRGVTLGGNEMENDKYEWMSLEVNSKW
jgi:hypothetical protein